MTAPSAKNAYDAAADLFDSPACSFFPRAGETTIARLDLQPGMRVLDVCCGSGASAIPAAHAVGRTGEVIGLDVAPRLLELAEAKAKAAGLENVRFINQDALEFEDDDGFDAVVCVYGIFFMPDMTAAAKRLWSHVRLDGRLALTTWAESCLEPGASAFWDAVRSVRPDLHKSFNPWDAITRTEAVLELYDSAGITGAHAKRVADAQPLERLTDWWTIVMGTGFRGTVDLLAPDEVVQVHDANLAAMEGAHQVNTSSIYAVAKKS